MIGSSSVRRTANAATGAIGAPLLLRARPERPVGGKLLETESAPSAVVRWVEERTTPEASMNSVRSRPLIVAGFQ